MDRRGFFAALLAPFVLKLGAPRGSDLSVSESDECMEALRLITESNYGYAYVDQNGDFLWGGFEGSNKDIQRALREAAWDGADSSGGE